MSERKPRYFQHEFGGVYYATLPDAVADYENDRTMTEVQVVPVDAVVVNGVLPKVKIREAGFVTDRKGIVTVPTDGSVRPEVLVENALAYLALAKYLREHPLVDEEQVAAVRDALLSADSDDVNYIEGDDAWKLARRMVERGVRVEQP